jgi:hypothetical protein
MSFGILTLATRSDALKAIGLALSLRVSNPGVPIAIACAPALRPVFLPHFDLIIDEDPSLRGFVHKVHLDRYSPFDDTFFFDADVLVFRNLRPKVEEWSDQVYNACGVYCTDGASCFGLDRRKVMGILGKDRVVEIAGAGHAYFRKPGCGPVFERARAVTHEYHRYAGDARYADEDAMNIVLTEMAIEPRPHWEFLSRHLSATPGTLRMDASIGQCEMIEVSTGRPLRPYMMHFAANEAPFVHARQLNKLFRKFGVSSQGLYRQALGDFWREEVRGRASRHLRRWIRIKRRAPARSGD